MGNFTDAIRLPSVKFPTIGSAVTGTVLEIGTSDVPKFDAKGRIDGVMTNEDGGVIQQIDVILNVEDKRVVLHTGGWIFYAIGRALAEIGADDLEIGDSLTVTYTGDGEQTTKGRNAPKQYRAEVVKA